MNLPLAAVAAFVAATVFVAEAAETAAMVVGATAAPVAVIVVFAPLPYLVFKHEQDSVSNYKYYCDCLFDSLRDILYTRYCILYTMSTYGSLAQLARAHP